MGLYAERWLARSDTVHGCYVFVMIVRLPEKVYVHSHSQDPFPNWRRILYGHCEARRPDATAFGVLHYIVRVGVSIDGQISSQQLSVLQSRFHNAIRRTELNRPDISAGERSTIRST